jgi:hypothetical protein
MTYSNGKPPIITSAHSSNEEQALSLEEQRQLAGAESTHLLDTADLLESEPQSRGMANAPLPRTILVLSCVGMFALFGLMLMFLFGLGRGKRVAEQLPETPEARSTQPSQTDQLKTQLALIGQQQDTLPKPGVPEVIPPPKPSPVVVQSTPRPIPTAAPQPVRSFAPPSPVSRSTPQVDPNELWARLSTTASVSGEVPLPQNSPRSIARTISQPEYLVASARLGDGALADSRSPSRGEQGILQQTPVDQVQSPQSRTVPIGSFAKARVTVPMIWGGEESTLTRAAVRLSEPLLDATGAEALPEGTTFITEVTQMSRNGLVEQTAIAALYEREGELVQETIQPGVIVIRGKRNQPLMANQVGGRRGLDLSRSLASAIAGVGRELGQPEFVSSVFTGDRSVTRTEQDTGQAIAGGALEGFFGTAADQLSEQARDQRSNFTPVFVVEEGERVSVVVNGFLEVYR